MVLDQAAANAASSSFVGRLPVKSNLKTCWISAVSSNALSDMKFV